MLLMLDVVQVDELEPELELHELPDEDDELQASLEEEAHASLDDSPHDSPQDSPQPSAQPSERF